ncbi:recombinase family protein [Streptomyces sp. YGL11-2]|uniref:recombinase family protein n=1 Tax=Streptomyces sp. YGL11-2 TaxID=3414028 RepID=UPI003CE97D9E
MTPLANRTPDWRRNLDQVRAVSYIRQSKRREDDSQASPEAQREKCEALITAKGWDLAGSFADVGRSGWDPNVERPEFEEMMTAVRAGHVDAVVVFALSRLTSGSRARRARRLGGGGRPGGGQRDGIRGSWGRAMRGLHCS